MGLLLVGVVIGYLAYPAGFLVGRVLCMNPELKVLLIWLVVYPVVCLVVYLSYVLIERIRLSPGQRAVLKAEKRARQARRDRASGLFDWVRKAPVTRRVRYDVDTGVVTAYLFPHRTWRGWIVRRFVWLTKHRMFPVGLLRTVKRTMGFSVPPE